MDNVCNRCLFSIPSKVEMAEEQEYIHRFPESFVRDLFATKRCSIKLKAEEAEIKLTGSRLEEEVNVPEIEGG